MTRVYVEPGICGSCATIDARRDGQKDVQIRIQSGCEKVMAFGRCLGNLSFFDILPRALNESTIYEKAGQCELHGSCPIPCAVMKAAEVELELAMKKEVKITFQKHS